MALVYNVRGPAIVSCGVGSANALVTLGVSVNGVQPVIQNFTGNIFSDVGGPSVAVDKQDFGMQCVVRCRLIAIDWTYANTIMARGDRSAVGKRNTPGLLLGTGGYTFSVAVSSANDAPFYMPNAWVDPDYAMNFGTQANPDEISFIGWGFIAATALTGVNTTVYARATS